ncbi:methyltransferase [Methylocystis parvus]|uniref:methyltransferase n=1 Tax=Methylocystis parvus TaxID=134 RepID=UPI003C736F70
MPPASSQALGAAASLLSSWRDRWINWRNGLVADQRFQRWAAASPLTRFIARRRAKDLFDLCAGFVYSQILLACVRLKLFEMLRAGPLHQAQLAARMQLSPEAAQRLLRAAASLKLLRALPGDRYALDDLGASMLANPSVGAFVEHHALLYDDLSDPVALLRGETRTKLSQFWPYAKGREGDSETCGAYSDLMARSQKLIAEDVLDAYRFGRHECLLDVGGGEGAFVAAVAARHPTLRLQLFDLPPVAERARDALAARGLSRVETHGGSFLDTPLPKGAEIVTLIRVLHDHDDAVALAALRAAHAALPSGGALLVAEPMAETPGAEAIGDAYFGFYLLAMGSGRARRRAEMTQLLQAAGFTDIRFLPTARPMFSSVVVGRKV